MAPFDGKYMTSYVMAIVIFALCLAIYTIFANLIKQNFSFPATFMQNHMDTLTHTRTHTARDRGG